MQIVLKAIKPDKFWEEVERVKDLLETNGSEMYVYKTDNGEYEFMRAPGMPPRDAYVTFTGKRTAFGMTQRFRVRRIKKMFGNDIIKMKVGSKDFRMKITWFGSSAKDKPFWANCSKEDYRALQKLKAR